MLLFSCKEGEGDKGLVVEIVEEIRQNPVVSMEILKNKAPVRIVDYKGLAPFLSKQNDTTYVINFWATWCKPCIKKLPAFEELGAAYATKPVKVVLVSLDFPEQLEKQVRPFVKKNAIKSEIILLDDADANFWIPAIDESWTGAIPATIIYNKNNRTFYERSFTYVELEKEVELIL